MSHFWCEAAWIGGAISEKVLIECDEAGTIAAIENIAVCPPFATAVPGLTFPGFANTHSHAFHRALRGRVTQDSFWGWRDAMYELAARLDPESYLQLATAVFAEMALAGFTVVGEFHYLHHQAGGRPYDDPNAMGNALTGAAKAAGIRLTLLDTCYLQGGLGKELSPPQRRFADADVDDWARRRALLKGYARGQIGAAIHSVRAVPREAMSEIAAAGRGGPLHIHLSEQPAENQQTLAAHGMSPTALLAKEGVLSEDLTAVHAIHLEAEDIALLSSSGATVCACPTTEADLGDGIGPFAELHRQKVSLTIGTDQHVFIDPFLEIQRLEMDQRLLTRQRSVFNVREQIDALTQHGYRALGWTNGGLLEVGALCDLTSMKNDSVRTAGVPLAEKASVASAVDVETVVVGGRVVVASGQHVLGEIPALLREAIDPLWG
ncbi:formimidoylglutamate deiminase [soil metagenome]